MQVNNDIERKVWDLAAPVHPHPYEDSLPGGFYRVIGQPESGFSEYRRTHEIAPPWTELVIDVR